MSHLSTKQKILKWQSEIEQAKEMEFKSVLEKKEEISQEIATLFQKIQKKDYRDLEEFKEINSRLEQLSENSKKVTEDYQKQMKKRFKELYVSFPTIYDMLVNREVDQSTLRHVLDTFDRVERGHMTGNDGIAQGLDYMSDKYNLPGDFFNKDAIGKPTRRDNLK